MVDFVALPLYLLAVIIYASYRFFQYYSIERRYAQFALAHGCKPLKRWKTRDPILGLDFRYAQYLALKAHKVLETIATWFGELGVRTARLVIMRKSIIKNTTQLTLLLLIISGFSTHRQITTEPENLKAMLSTNFKSYALPMGRKKHLGEGIFTTDGEAWKHSHELLRPAFTRSRIDDVDAFETHVQRLIALIPGNGETECDLQPLFFARTMDVATEFLFGEIWDFGADGGEGGKDGGGVWGFIKLFLPNWEAKRRFKTVDNIIDRGLATHSSHNNPPSPPPQASYIFLQELLSQPIAPSKPKLRSELLSTLLASRDTTASALSNIWFEISKHAKIWTRLQAEIRALQGTCPTFAQLKELKYLHGVIKESLRLYPVVPENSREAVEDTVLPVGGGGDERAPVVVRKGWMVHWSLWMMHRRTDLCGLPERWVDSDSAGAAEDGDGIGKGLRVGWEYLPFHGGPRVCIGQQFALMEMAYVTVRLLQAFDRIERRDLGPWVEKITMTVTGLNGARVVLRARA